MNAISDNLRRNLFSRLPPEPEPAPKSTSPEDKLMEHFETINKVAINDPNNRYLENKEGQFEQAMVYYSSKVSFIDTVVASNEHIMHLAEKTEKIAQAPLVPNLKPSSNEEIKSIRLMFEGKPLKQNFPSYENTLLVIQEYAEILVGLGRHNLAAETKALALSKAIIKNPTYTNLQIQTDPKDFQSSHSMNRQLLGGFVRSKRKDLILMQILKEKKRKDFVQDYFGVMEVRLMELLDFILQDQEQYVGLQPESKIKLVLKNLEKFQGKTLEGESKINLLKIFFEEFTALKKQKDELEALKTPMRRLENKERPHGTTSTKAKEDYRASTTPQKKPTPSKVLKKGSHIKWIENEAIDRKKKGEKSKQGQTDEWIGNLH